MDKIKRGPKPKPEGEKIVLIRVWVKKKNLKKAAREIKLIEKTYA